MKRASGYSCWYNGLQGALYLLAFLTLGLGDGISFLWMIQQQGIMKEGNPIIIFIILNYGTSTFLEIKMLFYMVILYLTLLVQKWSEEPIYWTVNFCLILFIIIGTLLTILNIQAARNDNLFLSLDQILILFMILVMIFTAIGQKIDARKNLRIGNYFDCI
ncbi:MAG: hypothetical protein J5U19_05225 [Candidatus Methanoperedens sp.]|nr:hypothetical protein [Candidatus Methanoperedens sp.]